MPEHRRLTVASMEDGFEYAQLTGQQLRYSPTHSLTNRNVSLLTT
jgi:hypothetical protein